MQCGCFWSSLLSVSAICPENAITDQRVPFFNQEAVSICLFLIVYADVSRWHTPLNGFHSHQDVLLIFSKGRI